MSYSGTKRQYGSSLRSYGGRSRRSKYSSRLGKPMIGRNTGPGRGFKGNFFRLQRAPYMSRELGYIDIANTDYNFDTTGSIALLNTVAQGASVNQRVGKKIAMKGLQCRGIMYNNTTAVFNDIAFLIVYDKRPTGALPNITDILNSAAPTAMNNDANAGRFSILKRVDSVLIGNQTVQSAVGNFPSDCIARDADFYLDLKGREVVYKAAATGAIGDIEQGALYIVTVGGRVAGTTAATLAVAFRLRFLDI